MNLAEPSVGKRDCPSGSDFSLEGSGTLLYLSVVAIVALCPSAVNMAAITHRHSHLSPTEPQQPAPHAHPADYRVTCPRTAQLLLDRLLLFFYVIRRRLKYEGKCLDCKQSVTSKVPHVSEHLAALGRLRG